ncbi:MAG: hypothetical protein ACYTGZ_05395 [Planctomycetota bacterium]|jgi:hypothetical protein
MRLMIGLLALAVVAVAQDSDKNKARAEIKRLEARAEKLLADGKRVQAFDALARAAEIREKLEGSKAKKAKGKTKAEAKPKQNPKPKPKMTDRPKRAGNTQAAYAALARAIGAGNKEAAMKAAANLRNTQKRKEARLNQLLAAARDRNSELAARLTRLEKQVAELKALMDR